MSLHDISDLPISSVTQGGTLYVPTRPEKKVNASLSTDIVSSEYHITAAMKPFQQYARIRLAGRGGPTPGQFDPADSLVYSFLINPSEVRIQRQTIDHQSMARAGWMIGVWGEDFVSINLTGKTPGKYFAGGLTDAQPEYTQSYRNLAALEMVYENNGYWFEGEQVASRIAEAPRRIKAHQDVELTVGEFIWSGMFETMELTEDAESPFLVSFSMTFIAWNERFRRGTPYRNAIGGETQRGHVPFALPTAPSPSSADNTLAALISNPRAGGWGTA